MALSKPFVLERLQAARDEVPLLKQKQRSSSEFKRWQRDTRVLLEQAFGTQSTQAREFQAISYTLQAFASTTPDSKFEEAYRRGLSNADAMLGSMYSEVQDFWPDQPIAASGPSAVGIVELLANRFQVVARQIRRRYAGRPTVEIADEYDVQDLLHALLRLWFDDVRNEEWTPSYAGKSSRVDFLLKDERTVIEVKKTRAALTDGKLGDELAIDIMHYAAHPDCDRLICFVYDPDGIIKNPAGLAKDLGGTRDGLEVLMFIRPI